MKIINLIEDTDGANGCAYEHGLSFYAEINGHKLLVDTGASGAFIENARKKGIDLGDIDTVIISHGHYDHAGGLISFANINSNARIYMHKLAFGEFYSLKNEEPKYIGIDSKISSLDNLVLVDTDVKINDNISLFCGIDRNRLLPKGNNVLKVKTAEGFARDTFDHELCVSLKEGDTFVLISGCAHNGILNILDKYKSLYGRAPTYVVSGFHTVKKDYTEEDDDIIRGIGKELSETSSKYYSGHCTGEHALHILSELMGDKLTVIHSGDNIL